MYCWGIILLSAICNADFLFAWLRQCLNHFLLPNVIVRTKFAIIIWPSRTCELLLIPKKKPCHSRLCIAGLWLAPCSLRGNTGVSEEHAVSIFAVEIIRVSMLSVCMDWHGMWLLRARQERRDTTWASRGHVRRVLAEFYVHFFLARLLPFTHRRCSRWLFYLITPSDTHSHTHTHTLCNTPLNEEQACRRGLYLHSTHH
jgi:hypothetical protein